VLSAPWAIHEKHCWRRVQAVLSRCAGALLFIEGGTHDCKRSYAGSIGVESGCCVHPSPRRHQAPTTVWILIDEQHASGLSLGFNSPWSTALSTLSNSPRYSRRPIRAPCRAINCAVPQGEAHQRLRALGQPLHDRGFAHTRSPSPAPGCSFFSLIGAAAEDLECAPDFPHFRGPITGSSLALARAFSV